MSSGLIDTTEMYLRTIYELHEEGIDPLRARIVERLHQSGPTVSQTVARLERDGLLKVDTDRWIRLSEEGWRRATSVMRRHRLLEVMMSQLLDMEYLSLHRNACDMEHVVSQYFEDQLRDKLGDPKYSPYGNPIPVGEIGDPKIYREGVLALSKIASDKPVTAKLDRITETVQNDDDVLSAITSVGLVPGAEFEATIKGEDLALTGPTGRVKLARNVADGLWVADK